MTPEPRRIFDPMIPLADCSRPFPNTEDRVLTNFLEAEIDDLLSQSEVPPPCPHCDGNNTVLFARAASPKPVLPVFQCKRCKSHFRRTTGTPLAGLKFHNLPVFLKLLSQQRPIKDAAKILGVKPMTLSRWVRRIRQWLLTIDTTGYWEAKVRLGMVIGPDIDCPSCNASKTMNYRGFSSDTGDRVCWCSNCNRYYRLSNIMPTEGFMLDHYVKARLPSPRKRHESK